MRIFVNEKWCRIYPSAVGPLDRHIPVELVLIPLQENGVNFLFPYASHFEVVSYRMSYFLNSWTTSTDFG